MATGILVLVEHQDGRPKKTAFELLGKASALNIGPVSAAVVGPSGLDMTEALASYGASKVYYACSDALAKNETGPMTRALEAIVGQADPAALFAAASPMGKDVLPRLAARLKAGVAADCIDLSADGGRVKGRRTMYAGKAVVDVEIPAGLGIFTVRPNSFGVPAAGSGSAEAVAVSVTPTEGDLEAQITELVKGAEAKVDLTEADRIVCGGRSLASADNFKILEDLASTINAAVGASRAAVDAGYVPHEMQIGQTGKVVNPSLYIGFGISGAIQHLAGMRSSKVIVAVNKDPEAPIFQAADYGIVADLFEAAPAMNESFKKLLAS